MEGIYHFSWQRCSWRNRWKCKNTRHWCMHKQIDIGCICQNTDLAYYQHFLDFFCSKISRFGKFRISLYERRHRSHSAERPPSSYIWRRRGSQRRCQWWCRWNSIWKIKKKKNRIKNAFINIVRRLFGSCGGRTRENHFQRPHQRWLFCTWCTAYISSILDKNKARVLSTALIISLQHTVTAYSFWCGGSFLLGTK